VRDCIVARTNWIDSRDRYAAMLLGQTLDKYMSDPANAQQVLGSVDFGALELTTHAQSCLWLVGYSRLGEAINTGADLHCALAAKFLGISLDEFMRGFDGHIDEKTKKFYKAVRTAVKAANFGFPGGMGPVKMALQQRKQGPDTTAADGKIYKGLRFCVLLGAERCGVTKLTEYKRKPTTPVCSECVRIAEDIRAKWFDQWPENREYFEQIAQFVEDGQLIYTPDGQRQLAPAQIAQHMSMRLRGGVEFTSAANGFFQGLAGDGAKLALCRVSRECYDHTYRMENGERSPLWGCRVILFAHDELIVEGPRATLHLWGPRISVVMISAMREFTPDVAVTAPAAAARRWWKSMEPVYQAPDGRLYAKHRDSRLLVPWTPTTKYEKE
jgi:DNA polymerase I-like protein with 3'-5' exonuclease and polymerase domains